MSTNRVLIVLPTYNELDNLPVMIEAIHRQLPAAHVLVVDDGSPDGTGALADRLAIADPRVSVLHRPKKSGLGSAYIAGFRRGLAEGYEYLFEMDCDFSHDPARLPALLAAVQGGADLALGSRYVRGGGTTNWTLGRKIISRGGNIYASTILGLPIRDLTGGFKCFRRRVLETIDLDAVSAQGYGFQIEMTYRAHQLGFAIVELPIQFADRRVGVSKMSGSIFTEALWLVWRLRFSPNPAHRLPERATR